MSFDIRVFGRIVHCEEILAASGKRAFMRYLVIIFLLLAVNGCALLPNTSLVPVVQAAPEPTLGMTRAQVTAIMSRTVTIGYEVDPVSGAVKPLEINSLYSTEMLTVGNDFYLVDSFITGPAKAGIPVTEAELTPMIFKNDLLCGKGRSALAAIKAAPEPAREK
ncbi:MAG: hypothetical protein HQL20_11265 [Candidatus Omnitrophica bacterium]|nr:hypothetical protein [Candidatus Omnitrophota bacterium]